ncbi:trichohyalin-like [Palaemon carinicauda]|uniref:trichohyalin-like n=1 Tax=Palaemon carinicauda TaxID=392227 RepID=UPI0035B5DD19
MAMFNQEFGVWVNMIGEFVRGKYNWPQNAASVIQERNTACEDMTLYLQGQLRTLHESSIFKWFSWLLPEAPHFGDCSAVASQEGFLGRWLQHCPWIGGFWKAREELRGCELGLQRMKEEALRFNDQLKSRWFVSKLLPKFEIGEWEDILSHGNKTIYIGMAAAGTIFGGIMWAMRRRAKEGEGVPELAGEDFATDCVDRTTLLENLQEENYKLHGQLNDLIREVDEMNREKETQEKLKAQKEEELQKLKIHCDEKDLQMKEQEEKQEILKTELEEIKKIHKEKIDRLQNDCVQKDRQMKEHEKEQEILETELEEIKKIHKEKIDRLQNDCVQKDRQMKEQEKLLEILKIENGDMKKAQNQKTDQLNQLRSQIIELERELQEKLRAKMASDYENLKKECANKDDQIKRQERLLEILRTGNKGPKKVQRDPVNKWKKKVDELNAEKEEQEKLKGKMETDYQNLLNECAKKDLEMKKQAMLLEVLKNENEATQEQKERLREEVSKLKAENQAKEEMKAERNSDQEKENESVKKNVQKKEQPKNGEMKRESKKETGNKHEDKRTKLLKDGLLAHENKRFDEAMALFTEALAIDTDKDEQTALLHILRAEANAASGNPQDMDIILDCCQAIEKGLQGCRSYMLRGKHLLKLGLFDAAQNDFEAARKVSGSKECLKFIEEAKALKKKWESQSHYEVLGVAQTASRAEILKSFKRLSMNLHPDRHRDKPEFIQGAFEEKFKKVVNAKIVLMDEQSRRTYDAEFQRQRPRQQPGQWDQRRQNFYHKPEGNQYQYYFYQPTGGQSHQWNHPGHNGTDFGNIFDFFDIFFRM